MSRAIYNVLGVDRYGFKDLLGMYVSQSEGANFWLGVLTDLKNRGVKDILIACVDGLRGFPDAINAVFPQTDTQLAQVHRKQEPERVPCRPEAYLPGCNTGKSRDGTLEIRRQMGRKVSYRHPLLAG